MALEINRFSIPQATYDFHSKSKRKCFTDILSSKKIEGGLSKNTNRQSHTSETEKWFEMKDSTYNRRSLDNVSNSKESDIPIHTNGSIDIPKNKNTEKTDMFSVRYTSYYNDGYYTDPETGDKVTHGHIDRVFYTKDGIFSVTIGQNSKLGHTDTFNWKIDFGSEDEYERVMKFLDKIPVGDDSVFTTREYFWSDFLNGEIDEDEFLDYYSTLDHGKANFIRNGENGSSIIDREMMASKYFWYFGIQKVEAPTAEELEEMLFKGNQASYGKGNANNFVNIESVLRERYLGKAAENILQFYGEDNLFSLDEWIREIIQRTRDELAEKLCQRFQYSCK